VRIQPRSAWGARYANGDGPAPLPASGGVALHHSVGPARNGPAVIRDLEDIGQERFGAGISYTFPITVDGTVYEGHSVDRKGSHTGGHNSTVRAIVLVGNYEDQAPTPQQIESAAQLLAHGVRQGWWPTTRLRGHRDFKSTACPGGHAYAAIPTIVARANQLLAAPTTPTTEEPEMNAQERELLTRAVEAAERAEMLAQRAVDVVEARGYDPRNPKKDVPAKGTGVARLLNAAFRDDRANEADARRDAEIAALITDPAD
jgi:hypothetical protein